MTFEKREKFIRQDGIEEGFERGLEQGIEQGQNMLLISLLRQGIITIDDAAKGSGLSVEEIQEMLKENME